MVFNGILNGFFLVAFLYSLLLTNFSRVVMLQLASGSTKVSLLQLRDPSRTNNLNLTESKKRVTDLLVLQV